MSSPPVPTTWLRCPWILQTGDRRSKENVDEAEQLLTIRRWLAELARLAQEHAYDYSQDKELHAGNQHDETKRQGKQRRQLCWPASMGAERLADQPPCSHL